MMLCFLLLAASLLSAAPAYWTQKSVGANPVAPFTLARVDTTIAPQVHDTADSVRAYARARIHDTADVLRDSLARRGTESTGLWYFPAPYISIASSTTFSVAPVRGQIVNTTGAPGLTRVRAVNFAGVSGVTPASLTTAPITYLLLDSTGALVQQPTVPTLADVASMIYLGSVNHPGLTTITSVAVAPDVASRPQDQLNGLWKGIGYINRGVTAYPHGGDLSLNISGGDFYGDGIGWANNAKTPVMIPVGPYVQVSMRLRTRSSTTSASTLYVDPANWDNGGTLTPVGGGINSATNQRIFISPAGQVIVAYGQQVYGSLAAAVAGLGSETFVVDPVTNRNLQLLGTLSVIRSATALNNTAQAIILNASKFGEVAAGSAGTATITLQGAYDNSTPPQILTDATRGALTLKRGSANDTDAVIAVQNGAGATTATINGSGRVLAASVLVSGATASKLARFDASKYLTSYDLVASDIPSLDASKITTGTFLDVRIASAATWNAKEPGIAAGTTAQYWRGDKTWQTLNTTAVAEGANLYYTDTRARAAISATSPIAYSAGVISHLAGDGQLHVPATSTTNNGKFLKAGATAGSIAWTALDASDITTGTLTVSTSGSAATLTTSRGISMTGDGTWSVSFNGGSNVSGAMTLASVITAGSAGSASQVPVVTWDAKGRLTAVSSATITPAAIGAQPAGSYQPLENQRLSTTNSPTFGGIAGTGIISSSYGVGPNGSIVGGKAGMGTWANDPSGAWFGLNGQNAATWSGLLLAYGNAYLAPPSGGKTYLGGAVNIGSLTASTLRMATVAADGTIGATSWAYDGPWLSLTNGGTVSGYTNFANDIGTQRQFVGNGDIFVRSGTVLLSVGDGNSWTTPAVYFPATSTDNMFRVAGGSRFDHNVSFEPTTGTAVYFKKPTSFSSAVSMVAGSESGNVAPSGYIYVTITTSGTTVLPAPSAGAVLIVQRIGGTGNYYVKPPSGATIAYTDLSGVARQMTNSATNGLNIGGASGAMMFIGGSSGTWGLIGAWPQGS